jgi:hypothetical protein
VEETRKANAKVWLIDRPSWASKQRLTALSVGVYEREARDAVIRHVYINERDRFMVGQLQMRLEQSKPGELDKVLCVVGRNHLEGMASMLREGTIINDKALERLVETPEGGPLPDNLHEHVEKTTQRYYLLIGGVTTAWLLMWGGGYYMNSIATAAAAL